MCFAHMLIKIIESRQGFQTQLASVALLRFVCMDSLQMNLQDSQAVEISLGAIWTTVGKFA